MKYTHRSKVIEGSLAALVSLALLAKKRERKRERGRGVR